MPSPSPALFASIRRLTGDLVLLGYPLFLNGCTIRRQPVKAF